MLKEEPNQYSHCILHAKSDRFYWRGQGALSIKTFSNGRALYHTGHGHFAVEEDSYLLLNHGQDYSITIEEESLVESFCIFFPEPLIREIYYSLHSSPEHLLDEPFPAEERTIDFVEKTYKHPALTATVHQMKSLYPTRQRDYTWLEEQLHILAQGLLTVHRLVQSESLRLPSLKASKREELYKRIQIGHEFINAYYQQPITLADIARTACLSPNHFLRSYKQLFGMSPHQYVTEKRLQKARRLLFQTDMSITSICLEVGFHSPSSFSGLFSKRFGSSPSQARHRQKR